MIGRTVSHYKIIEKLGEGGMGAVYLAEDQQLERTVAIKFLPSDVGGDPGMIARFRREARSAARLKHPNIVTIHEFGEYENIPFLVMEHVEGRTLTNMLGDGPLPVDTSINIALQLCEGLGKAHAAGVIHRDIKPDNVIIDNDGRARILDFGIAKFEGATALTAENMTVGTAAYMSPEQATGGAVDHRSDIFSLGAVLYEMLTGKPPFGAGPTAAVLYRIVHEAPDPLPTELHDCDEILSRALTKDPGGRFQTAAEFAAALRRVAGAAPTVPRRVRSARRSTMMWGGALAILCVIGALIVTRALQEPRWDDVQSLARVRQLIDADRLPAAFELAQTAPDHGRIPERLWRRISRTVTIRTDPPGARVSVRPWGGAESGWVRMGETPLDDVTVAAAVQIWHVEKQGYPPLDLAYDGNPEELAIRLLSDSTLVSVPGGRVRLSYLPGLSEVKPVILDDYSVNRKEVTNREFQEFVDAGGYKRREYWDYPFMDDGRELDFDEAMRRFVDATGRPGPSTWRLGKHPEGHGEFPVAGVSWFEAAAYAKFAGKQLPTIFHWFHAAGRRMAPALGPAGNYGGGGPRPVDGSVQPGAYGIYDMAGNVREWCLNAAGDSRFILGGGWSEPSYMFLLVDYRSPFDRSPSNGIRCVDYSPDQGPAPETAVSVEFKMRDVTAVTPVSDNAFDRIVHFYDYTPVKLDATAVKVDESPYWTRERVEYSAGYDDERMFAWLFLPKSSQPPYQAVVLVPGGNAFDTPSSASVDDLVSWDAVDFVVEEGRAVMCPVFKYMYERRTATNANDLSELEWRDATANWAREIRQSMSYLDSRDDIDMDRVAYYGTSLGAMIAPDLLVLESRFRTAIFRHGGFWLGDETPLPEYDAVNFAPRVTIPILMMNGRYDPIFPVESSQRPFFEMLGTPSEAKRYVLFDVGHDFPPRNEMIRETLDWLDAWMGQVQSSSTRPSVTKRSTSQ